MYALVVIFHVVACLALILIVLLQTGRGAEIGAAFGGSSQTLFGSTGGTTFLGKITAAAAIVFMVTCLGLTFLQGRPATSSLMENVKTPEAAAPVVPEAKPVEKPAAPQAAPAPAPAVPPATSTGEQPKTQ